MKSYTRCYDNWLCVHVRERDKQINEILPFCRKILLVVYLFCALKIIVHYIQTYMQLSLFINYIAPHFCILQLVKCDKD